MSEHEQTEPEEDERADAVEDLEVPEGQQDDVAGGFSKIEFEQER
jgi:hypothetical protein